MTNKLRIDIKTVIVIVAINVIGSLLLGWLLGAISFFEVSGSYDYEYLKIKGYESGKLIYAVGYETGHLVGYIIVNFVVYLLYKPRKKDFLFQTEGLLTKKDGLVWHLDRYKNTEIAILIVQSIIFLVLQLCFKEHSAFALIYRALGIPFGFVGSILVMAALQISHIVASQYYWRIRYYMGI